MNLYKKFFNVNVKCMFTKIPLLRNTRNCISDHSYFYKKEEPEICLWEQGIREGGAKKPEKNLKSCCKNLCSGNKKTAYLFIQTFIYGRRQRSTYGNRGSTKDGAKSPEQNLNAALKTCTKHESIYPIGMKSDSSTCPKRLDWKLMRPGTIFKISNPVWTDHPFVDYDF